RNQARVDCRGQTRTSRSPRRRAIRCPRLRRPHSQAVPADSPDGGSSAAFEAKGEALGKSGFPYGALRSLDVVAHTAELEGFGLDVPHAIAGGRQTVPRLTNAAGIDQRGSAETECVHAVFVSHRTIRQPKYARHMRVAVKADATRMCRAYLGCRMV